MITVDFAEVHGLATVKSLIEPMRRAFSSLECSPERAHYDIGTLNDPGTLLVMPAWRPAASIGVKVSTVFPRILSEAIHPSREGIYCQRGQLWSRARPSMGGCLRYCARPRYLLWRRTCLPRPGSKPKHILILSGALNQP